MLSKMARPETYEDGERCLKLTLEMTCNLVIKKLLKWQKKHSSNGRIITLDIINHYDANAYIYTLLKICKLINYNTMLENQVSI